MPLKNIKVTPGTQVKNNNEMVEYADDWKVESHTIHLDCSDVLGRCPSEASTLSANQDICRLVL